MKVSLNDVLNLKKIYSKFIGTSLPIKLVYKVSKLFRAVNEEFNFYQEQINILLNECAQRDDKGNFIPAEDNQGVLILDDKKDEANRRLQELLSLEVEMPDVTFTVDELDGMSISLEEFNYILPFME